MCGLVYGTFFSSVLFCPPIGTVYCLIKNKRNLNRFSLSLYLYYRPSHFSPRRPCLLLPLKALNGHVARLPLLLLVRWCQKPVADFFSRVSWHPRVENIRQKYIEIPFVLSGYALVYRPLYRIWLYAYISLPLSPGMIDSIYGQGENLSVKFGMLHWVCLLTGKAIKEGHLYFPFWWIFFFFSFSAWKEK